MTILWLRPIPFVQSLFLTTNLRATLFIPILIGISSALLITTLLRQGKPPLPLINRPFFHLYTSLHLYIMPLSPLNCPFKGLHIHHKPKPLFHLLNKLNPLTMGSNTQPVESNMNIVLPLNQMTTNQDGEMEK